MIINNISIKNLKSFGNDEQTIELNDEGNLILLSGRNGAGKSSIIDSIDYVLYNKVKGRKSKKVKLSSLPNRINGNLEVKIDFTSDTGTKVNVVRGYNPSKLSLYEDKVENLRAGKDNIQNLIENYVGIDHETFKGFISMSVNDFKNFISLTNEEKKLLLDKLFNLEVISTLNNILNSMVRENKSEITILGKEIDILEENISNIQSNIDKVKKTKDDSLLERINGVKSEIKEKKPSFDLIKDKITQIKDKKSEINSKIEEERFSLIQVNADIKQIDKQLDLYENDKCPVCQSDLSSGLHKGLKEGYLDRKKKLIELKSTIGRNGKDLTSKLNKIDILLEKANTKHNDLSSSLTILKREYIKLNEEKESNEGNNGDFKEFLKSIDELKDKKKVAEESKSSEEDKSLYHKEIRKILSESGVKKSIIKNIIEPINVFINENIQKMNLPFEVELDDTFTANITSFGEEIDIDTLSTGETKKINVAILIAYLKLIRTKRQVNVLFLDEVFSSVDVESINDVIRLLRDLADTSKINIFLVHHSILDSQHFDSIYEVKKDVFSYIEKIDIS